MRGSDPDATMYWLARMVYAGEDPRFIFRRMVIFASEDIGKLVSHSALPPRLSELVILITAREWTQNYEWAAHHRLALEGGLSPDVAAAVADGRRPEGMADDEEALYDFCTALHQDGRVGDAIPLHGTLEGYDVLPTVR